VTFEVNPTVTTDALDTAIRRLEAVQEIVAKYANAIAEDARRLVPVKTGALQRSITVHLEGLVAEISAGEGLTYAAAVEYGTARAAAQPFLRPAFERHIEAFVREITTLFEG
jgi:HK97 gp10 family phage protein